MTEKPTNRIDLSAKISDAVNGTSRNGLLILLFFIACSLVPLAYGGYKLHYFWDITAHGTQGKAEILRIEEVRSSSSSHSNYYPVIRFKDASETVHERKVERVKQFKYKPGETVDILYDRDNPSRVIIDSVKDQIVAPIILLLLGGVALWFVVVTALRCRRQAA